MGWFREVGVQEENFGFVTRDTECGQLKVVSGFANWREGNVRPDVCDGVNFLSVVM